MADEAVVRIRLEEGPSSKGASAPPSPTAPSPSPAPAAPAGATGPARDWVKDLVEGIAGANRHVLIEGQSGSGKSLMTRHLAFERMERGEEVSVVDTHSPESWGGAKQVFQGESAAAEAAQFLRDSLETRKAEASDAKMRGEMPQFEDMTIIFSDFARLMKDSPELGREFQTLLTEARKFRISIVADTTALTGAATGIKGIQDVINNFGQRVKLYAPTAADPQRHAEVGGEQFDTPVLPEYKDRTDYGLVKPYSAPPKTDANEEREQRLLELEAYAALATVRKQQAAEAKEARDRDRQFEAERREAEQLWLAAEQDMAFAAAEQSREYQQALQYQSRILEDRRKEEAAQAAEQSRNYQQRLQYESKLVEEERRAAEADLEARRREEAQRATDQSRKYQQNLQYESKLLEDEKRREAEQAAEQSSKYQQSLRLESKILEEDQRAAEREGAKKRAAEQAEAAEQSRKYQQLLRYESKILEEQQRADAPKAAKNVKTADDVRADRAAKYDKEEADRGGVFEVLNALRGTIGGKFGGMVGSALDVVAAMKDMRKGMDVPAPPTDVNVPPPIEDVSQALPPIEDVSQASEAKEAVGAATKGASSAANVPAAKKADAPPATKGVDAAATAKDASAAAMKDTAAATKGASAASSASSAAGAAASVAGPVAIAAAIAETVKKAVQGTVDVGFGIANLAANPNADAAASVEALGDAAKKGGESLGMLGGIAGDAVKQFGALMGALNKTADRYGEFSPQIAQAQATAEIKQTMGDLRRSQEISGEMAKYIAAQSDLQQKFEDTKIRLLNKMMPSITYMVELLELSMPAIEAIAPAIMALMSPLLAIPGALGAIEQNQKDALRPPPNDPTDLLLNSPNFAVDASDPRGAGGRWVPNSG